jgi:hypothetical protein
MPDDKARVIGWIGEFLVENTVPAGVVQAPLAMATLAVLVSPDAGLCVPHPNCHAATGGRRACAARGPLPGRRRNARQRGRLQRWQFRCGGDFWKQVGQCRVDKLEIMPVLCRVPGAGAGKVRKHVDKVGG